MAQEEFLQGGRTAGQRPDTDRGEGAEQLVQVVGVDLAAQPGARLLRETCDFWDDVDARHSALAGE